jgi:WD40 repeat protein
MGNQLPVFNRLEVPSFGLVWLTIDDTRGDAFVLIPGGGGSTKSGVKNQIQIGRIIDDKIGGMKFMKRFETDVDGKSVLCSGVAVGTYMGTKIVCALLDNICAILTAEKVGDDLVLKRVADFKADFSEDGSVNCACILPSGHIVTGGDDGICRLWAVGYINNEDTEKPCIWRVRMLSTMKGHAAAIMDIAYHPHSTLVSRVNRVRSTVSIDQFLSIRAKLESSL